MLILEDANNGLAKTPNLQSVHCCAFKRRYKKQKLCESAADGPAAGTDQGSLTAFRSVC